MAHLLKDHWLDNDKLTLLHRQAERDQQALQKSAARLTWADLDLSSDEAIRKLSDEDIDQRIDQAITGYRTQAKALMLGADTLDAALERYEDTRKVLKQHLGTIHRILDKYHDVPLKVDSHKRPWFDEKGLGRFLIGQATHAYKEQDKQLYSMLGDLADALDKLHTYEHEHGLISFVDRLVGSVYEPLSNIFNFDKQRFQMNPTLFNQMLDAGLVGESEVSEAEFKSRHNQV